jgi:hypothetical protein
MIDHLTNENFMLYASRNYDNPSCHSDAEFLEDLKRFKYLKKLVTRYVTTGVLKERLILNHIIVLSNLFGVDATPRMLVLKLHDQMHFIKPFLIKLNMLPETIFGVADINILKTDMIPMDQGVINALRKL